MEQSNYLHSLGDTLVFQYRPNGQGTYHLDNGVLSLSGNNDVVIGLYARIVEHGIIKGDWVDYLHIDPRTEPLFSNVSFTFDVDVPRDSVLEVKLMLEYDINPNVQHTIKFIELTANGTFTEDKNPIPVTDASMFSSVDKDVETNRLENNLFKKLYYRGIVPNYIKRGDNLSKQEDGDYISLFSAIARFFAMIMRFFKRWENMSDDDEALKEILRNNNIQFDETTITSEELRYLVNNLYNEISKRGTREIFRFKADVRPDGTVVEIDGEFNRLIRAHKYTEVLFENIPRYQMGWCLGNSSPMYRGISNEDLYLDKNDFEDKNSHLFSQNDFDKLLKFGNVTLQDTTHGLPGSGKTIECYGLSAPCGLGRLSESVDASDYLVKVDASMDYEITLGVCLYNQGFSSNSKITASVEGFDLNGEKLSDAFILPNRTVITNSFFHEDGYFPLNLVNNWVYIRFIIKAYSSQPQSSYKLNIGFGNELHFNNYFTKYILPTIVVDDAYISIANYHIRPLVRGTNINSLKTGGVENCRSLGFLKVSKFSHMYLRNRNTVMSEDSVGDFINRYLLPYNSANILTFI